MRREVVRRKTAIKFFFLRLVPKSERLWKLRRFVVNLWLQTKLLLLFHKSMWLRACVCVRGCVCERLVCWAHSLPLCHSLSMAVEFEFRAFEWHLLRNAHINHLSFTFERSNVRSPGRAYGAISVLCWSIEIDDDGCMDMKCGGCHHIWLSFMRTQNDIVWCVYDARDIVDARGTTSKWHFIIYFSFTRGWNGLTITQHTCTNEHH